MTPADPPPRDPLPDEPSPPNPSNLPLSNLKITYLNLQYYEKVYMTTSKGIDGTICRDVLTREQWNRFKESLFVRLNKPLEMNNVPSEYSILFQTERYEKIEVVDNFIEIQELMNIYKNLEIFETKMERIPPADAHEGPETCHLFLISPNFVIIQGGFRNCDILFSRIMKELADFHFNSAKDQMTDQFLRWLVQMEETRVQNDQAPPRGETSHPFEGCRCTHLNLQKWETETHSPCISLNIPFCLPDRETPQSFSLDSFMLEKIEFEITLFHRFTIPCEICRKGSIKILVRNSDLKKMEEIERIIVGCHLAICIHNLFQDFQRPGNQRNTIIPIS